jgi:hypothetical protein
MSRIHRRKAVLLAVLLTILNTSVAGSDDFQSSTERWGEAAETRGRVLVSNPPAAVRLSAATEGLNREKNEPTHVLPQLQEAMSPDPEESVLDHDINDQNSTIFMSSVRAADTSILILRYSGLPVDKPVCRVTGVCRMGDGSYLLPQWMKKYSGHLKDCGVEHAKYVLHKATSELDGDVWAVRGFRPGQINLTETFIAHDLIGGSTPRGENQWLVEDLTPSLFLLDMSVRFSSYERTVAPICVRQRQRPCPVTTSVSDLNPLLLVDVRVSEQESFLWPKGFIRLIRNGLLGSLQVADLQDIYGWRLRSQAACVRSLVSTRAQLAEIPSSVFDASHFFFEGNGLSRESPRVSDELRASKTTCDIKVLILSKYGKRQMVGDEALRTAIVAQARDAKITEQNVQFKPEVVYFEKASFHEQVSIMQESSVVVAAHGPSNANLVFLRPDTLFLEVVPFGLEPDTYKSLSRVYGARYQMIMAQPDEEVFRSCVDHFNPSHTEELGVFMKLYEAQAERFKSDAVSSDVNPSTEFRIPENATAELTKGVKNARHCANYQRLSFNVKEVAQLVVTEGLSQCAVGPKVRT